MVTINDKKNHRQEWTDREDEILVEHVIQVVSDGGTQRDAFKKVAELIGRTVGAVEYHWKKIRKDDTGIMESFQGAVADALISAVNDPQKAGGQDDISDHVVKEVTKGATKIHRMIEQIIKPGSDITLPPHVVDEITWTQENGDPMQLFHRTFLQMNEMEGVIDYIDESPGNARNFYRALECGFDVELTKEQKIRSIYYALNTIKPNEPGYMMARGMIVMMWHTMEILGADAEEMIGIVREMPF